MADSSMSPTGNRQITDSRPTVGRHFYLKTGETVSRLSTDCWSSVGRQIFWELLINFTQTLNKKDSFRKNVYVTSLTSLFMLNET